MLASGAAGNAPITRAAGREYEALPPERQPAYSARMKELEDLLVLKRKNTQLTDLLKERDRLRLELKRVEDTIEATERLSRQALHAHVLGFTHPSTGQPLRFVSPLPADLCAALLHEHGYRVVGITLNLWDYHASGGNVNLESGCCSIDTMADARAV